MSTKQEKLAVRCWLYDRFYRHRPQDTAPNVPKLQAKAKAEPKPQFIASVPIDSINSLIASHIKSGVWKIAPRPTSNKVKACCPGWESWGSSNKSSPISPSGNDSKSTLRNSSSISDSDPGSGQSFVQNLDPEKKSIYPTKPLDFGSKFISAPSKMPQSKEFQAPERKVHSFRDTGYSQRIFMEKPEQKPTISAPWKLHLESTSTFINENAPQVLARNSHKALVNSAGQMFDYTPSMATISDQESDHGMTMTSQAPLIRSDTLRINPSPTPQLAVFAKTIPSINSDENQQDSSISNDDIVFLNANTPWTTFICGLQGAGKSHSLSVLLENCLIPNPKINALPRPLSALVFSYSPYCPIGVGKPCEAAYLAIKDPSSTEHDGKNQIDSARKVTVLVSRSNYSNMRAVYAKTPGVTVKPLLLKPSQLTITTILKLMSVEADNTALYIQVVNRILRDMAAEDSGPFDYEIFKQRLGLEPLTAFQWGPLELRLELLESFIGSEKNANVFVPEPGSITIMDLTCPFLDAETACVLFSIGLDLFAAASETTGKVIALDEAHKFMSDQTASKDFANAVIRNIRLQRHLGLRTIISTQDPVVYPELLELASFIIMHRFDSPRWYDVLKRHVGFDSNLVNDSTDNNMQTKGLSNTFQSIMCLKTGEAFLYCPQMEVISPGSGAMSIGELGNKLLKVMMRKRLTMDGGASQNVI